MRKSITKDGLAFSDLQFQKVQSYLIFKFDMTITNEAQCAQKLRNLDFFYFVDSALKKAFRGVVIHVSVDFCSGEIDFFQYLAIWAHCVRAY